MNAFEQYFSDTNNLVNRSSIKDVYEEWLKKIKFNGNNIDITYEENGKKIVKKTKELIFCTSLISNPLDKSISKASRWQNIAALEVYSQQIMTDKVPDGFTYTYGSLLRHPVDQIERVIEVLKSDKNNRQATMMLGDGKCLWDKEPPCCRIVDLKLRKNYLNMHLMFRSHDITALPANFYGFAKLQEYLANEINAEVGYLACNSQSLHMYEGDCDLIGIKNFNELDKRLGEI